MKLLFAIVSSDDSNNVISSLMKNNFSATKLSSTGGFLRAGNATIVVGCDDDRVQDAINAIGEEAKRRTELVPTTAAYDTGRFASFPVEVTIGGATIFVVNVEEFYKL